MYKDGTKQSICELVVELYTSHKCPHIIISLLVKLFISHPFPLIDNLLLPAKEELIGLDVKAEN